MLLINRIIKKLIKKKITVSIAESYTGGLISSIFISIPGVSKVFNMGLITYSNKAKEKILNIDPITLKKYGAVSEEIAKSMAENLYKISRSKICISTTGIAGPGGGSKKKPVGLIFICIKYKNKIILIKKNLIGSRKNIQNKTIKIIFENLNHLI
tara:strand:+ start:1339 stop:1803 length:465 start_codon:yes stop_codon:yes gene_type:complete